MEARVLDKKACNIDCQRNTMNIQRMCGSVYPTCILQSIRRYFYLVERGILPSYIEFIIINVLNHIGCKKRSILEDIIFIIKIIKTLKEVDILFYSVKYTRKITNPKKCHF